MIERAPSYHGYRFPPDVIAHAVWLYFRFSLSFREVEDLLAQRGITVTYETIRQGVVRLRTNESPSTYGSRIRRQAAIGSWTSPRQCETQRTWSSSALCTGCCPAAMPSGVLPARDAWLRDPL